MNFRPLHDRILIKRIEEKETVKGGIIIPDTAKEKPQEGEVIAVGNGKKTEEGKVVPLDVKAGDRILFGKYSGTEIKRPWRRSLRVLLGLKPARFQTRPSTRSPLASQPEADRSFLFDSGRPSPPPLLSGKTTAQDSPAEAHLRIANGAGNKTPSATSAGSPGR